MGWFSCAGCRLFTAPFSLMNIIFEFSFYCYDVNVFRPKSD